MKNPLARLPWFVGGPGFLAAVLVAAFVANYLGADYFKRTRLDEMNPLAGAVVTPGASASPGAATGGAVLASGNFRGADSTHRGSGSAQVIRSADGKLTLRFEDFSVTNGPDLFVVLSTSADGYTEDGALNLGDLKATDGNFNYEIPAGTDFASFRSAVIWCRQFDVTFAVAAFAPMLAAAPQTTPTAGQASPPPSASPAASPAQAGATTVAPTVPAAATVAPAATATSVPTQSSGPVVLASGMFRDGEPGHRGSGTAKLGRDASGNAFLVFENFSVTNGPDLHVILGTNPSGGGQGVDLGKLKATDGTFSYPIPDGTDLANFRSVTIWCASFPTVFAVATLEA